MLRHAKLCLSSVALALVLCLGTASSAHAQYGTSVEPHVDGKVTYRRGNETLVQRTDGSYVLYRRFGNWHYFQESTGKFGAYFYDNVRRVQRFDIRDPRTGRREIGENPYKGNRSAIGWSMSGYIY
jgi:hypothetical protein